MYNNLLIDESEIESLKESTENFILNSVRTAMGADYFGGYFSNFGTCGLGKTCELCIAKVMSENTYGFSLGKVNSRSKMDIILKRGGKRIGIQIKMYKKYKKKFGLSRIDEDASEEDSDLIGTVSYKKMLKDECDEKGIDLCYILFISTSDGIANLRKFCRMDSGELVFENACDDSDVYRYKAKQTIFSINQEMFPLVGKRKFTPLKYTPTKFCKRVRSSDPFEIKKLAAEAVIKFKKFDNLALGKKWGDKGLAWEKFLIDYIRSRGIDIRRLEIRNIADTHVIGVGLIQIKYYDTKVSDNCWKILCRSSAKDTDLVDSIEHPFFEGEVYKPKSDNSDIRKSDVEGRIQCDLINSEETDFYILEGDGYRGKINFYHASELLEDQTVRNIGSFLRKGFYSSSGGKNGNQSHFRMKTRNLIRIDNSSDHLFEETVVI